MVLLSVSPPAQHAGLLEPEETTVARQWLGKHILMVTNSSQQ
jgi:hypothetical protein